MEAQTQKENLNCEMAWELQKQRRIQEEKTGDFEDREDIPVLEKGWAEWVLKRSL